MSLPETMSPAVAVIGLGNLLMSDEGIGVHLVRAAGQAPCALSAVEYLDLGTGGLTLLHALRGRRSAIIIDCARMGEPPGSLRRFTPEQVITLKDPALFSLHASDLLELLALSRRLGECPAQVIIFGIEPARLTLGDELSAVLAARFAEYLQCITDEIRAHGLLDAGT